MNNIKAELRITLDHNDGVVRAQTWMKGKVHLKTKEELDSALVDSQVILEMKGIEKARNPHTLMTLGIGRHEEKVVFEERRVLTLTNASLEANQEYEQPFSIYLPNHIPPSMEYVDESSGGSCCVSYTLTASMAGGLLTNERELSVNGSCVTEKKHPLLMEPENFPLYSTLHLKDEGYITMALKVENTHVAKGEIMEFSMALRNKSSFDVQRCEIKVVEILDWKTKLHEMKKERVLAYFPNVILEGIAGQVKGQKEKFPLDQVVDGLTFSEMHADLSSHQNQLHLKLPPRARNTYNGKIVKVQHFLQVTMIVREKNHNNPMMQAPLIIFDPAYEHKMSQHSIKSNILNEVAQTPWPDEKQLVINPLRGSADEYSSSDCDVIPEVVEDHGGRIPVE